MKLVEIHLLIAGMLMFASCASTDYSQKWSDLRSPEEVKEDIRRENVVIYSAGDFVAVPIGLNDVQRKLISGYPTEYLGTTVPSNVYHLAALYNIEVCNELLFATEGKYMVRSGDTFGRMAHKFGLSLKELIDMNPHIDPRRLQIGDILTVRKKHNKSGDDNSE